MENRREIDGLRAVAVLPVMLFHADLPGFGGGYLGVDVFFVISGYLITGILLQAHAAGGISIWDFYERRARRILPALFLVMAFCTVIGWFWLYPRIYQSFSESLGLTALFMSNLYFMTDTGYFADQADVRPLLHTWSLAVEEQFYLAYPLILIAVLRWLPKRLVVVIGLLALTSLGFALWAQVDYPDQNFFFPLSRAWELLAGALAAMVAVARPRAAVATAGLLLVIVAMVVDGGTRPFPTIWAFVTVVGTMMILRHGTQADGLARRVLSSRMLVGIGLVSYGAYLWHQPLMAFARLRMIALPPHWMMGLLVVVALGLGALTWRFVENPVRRRQWTPLAGRRNLFLAAGLGTAAFFVIGLAGFVTNGFPGRVSPQVRLASEAQIYNPWRPRCERGRMDATPVHPLAACGTLAPARNVLLIGDSHAAALAGVAMTSLQGAGYGTYVTTMGGCAVVPGLRSLPLRAQDDCRDFTTAALDFAAGVPDATVILALRWAFYLQEARFDTEAAMAKPGFAGASLAPWGWRDPRQDPTRRARVLTQMVAQVTALAARQRVVLIYPIPEPDSNVSDQAARQGMFGTYPAAITTAQADFAAENADLIAAFDGIDSPSLIRIRPEMLFCGVVEAGRCDQLRGDVILFADTNHVTRDGAARIVAAILAALD